MSTENISNNDNLREESLSFKKFVKKHFLPILLIIVSAIVIFIIAVFLLVWWVENSDAGGRGTWTWNEWHLLNLTWFFIYLAILEIVVIGILSIIVFLIFRFWWYNNLSEAEKDFLNFENRNKGKEGGGFGFFMFILFFIIVYFDGNLEANLGSLEYSYWIYAYVKGFIIIIVLAILGFFGYGLWKYSSED